MHRETSSSTASLPEALAAVLVDLAAMGRTTAITSKELRAALAAGRRSPGAT